MDVYLDMLILEQGHGGQAHSGASALRRLVTSGFDGLSRVAGVVALGISVVHPSFELWRDFRRSPATEVTNRGTELFLDYDPVRQVASFKFSMIFRNDGSRDDLVSDLSARFGGADDEQDGVANPDVGFRVENDPLARFPLVIPIGISRIVTVFADSLLDPPRLEALRGAGDRRLVVRLTGDNRVQHTLTYCFHLSEPVIAALFASETLQSRPFRLTGCN